MHTLNNQDGMNTIIVTAMQDSSTMETGELKVIPGIQLDEPLEIVHYTEIAKFYAINARDVWPLVHSNQIGNRVPYNSGLFVTGKNANRSERYWANSFDAHGNPTKVEKIRRVPALIEADDGMYVRYEDVVYYAEANGWTKGGGKPKSKEHQQTTSDLSRLSAQIAELTTLMGAFVSLSIEEKTATLKAKETPAPAKTNSK